jgi:hypothetical protein
MINYKRLQKLENHLRKGKLAHKKFDFSCFNFDTKINWEKRGEINTNVCGTAGCALGECPAVFKEWKWDDDIVVLKKNSNGFAFSDAETFFGLTEEQVEHLFNPNGQVTRLYGGRTADVDASRVEVANNIRDFIKVEKLKEQVSKLNSQLLELGVDSHDEDLYN